MKELYTRTRLCPYKENNQNCNLVMDPGIPKSIYKRLQKYYRLKQFFDQYDNFKFRY